MEGLDQAALRRFDLKARFGYLLPAQASELLRRYGSLMNLAKPLPAELASVISMSNLAPGDFAAVYRQARFRPIANVGELVAALGTECMVKNTRTGSIGFMR